MLNARRIILLGIVVIIILLRFLLKTPTDVKKTGDYFGEITPTTTAQIFSKNFVSNGLANRDATFTPDHNEFYYSCLQNRIGSILFSQKIDDDWTEPEIAPFSGVYSDIEPFITFDGSRLYFASNRPLNETDESDDYNIWYVERTSAGWGEPVVLPEPVNSDAQEFYPSLTKDGTIYFTAARDNGVGGEDIWCSSLKNGEYAEPVNLGEGVNSARGEFNAFVNPDGKYILFTTWGRAGGFGGGDLYISFADKDGVWQPAQNLGEAVNSKAIDYCPYVTRDEKFLFFTSSRANGPSGKRTYKQLLSTHNEPLNGLDDIYWISAEILNQIEEK